MGQKKMKIAVVLACFLAVAAAAPSDVVVGYDHGDHQHTQKGTPGNAVTGSYSISLAHAIQYVQVPQQYSTVQVQPQQQLSAVRVEGLQTAGFHGLGYHHQVQPYAIGGNYFQFGVSGATLGVEGEQEVIGQDGMRYILKKIVDQKRA